MSLFSESAPDGEIFTETSTGTYSIEGNILLTQE